MKIYDLVVIGAGPAGEVGAIRAAQCGMKVALIEKRAHLGGTCLNVGCIPTKALVESARVWSKLKDIEKEGFDIGTPAYDWQRIMDKKQGVVDAQRKGLRFLMKKNKIDVFEGAASFLDSKTIQVGEETLKAEKTLIATGSKVRELPFAISTGKHILTSDSILSLDHVPEKMAVIGGGVVGLEFASIFARFGSAVDVLEMGEQVIPSEDEECAKELVRQLKKQGVQIKTGVQVEAVREHDTGCELKLKDGETSQYNKVLVSIGREPVTEELNLKKIGVHTERGFIPVDRSYRTTCSGVFAVGDVIATPALAHTASSEALHAVEVMAGHQPKCINYDTNPSAVYTYPEVASVGRTEKQLVELGVEYKKTQFPFAPMAKAKIDGATVGFIKILSEPVHGELLGVHIVGTKATEMISEFVLGKVLETTLEEIGQAIHPHPTLSETIQEAAHAGLGGAIHL
ncbi:MAG: dihydrolipoyl dehydrogenase [Oligoflexales bacterium]